MDVESVVSAAAVVLEYVAMARGRGGEERFREGGRDGLPPYVMVVAGSVVLAVIFETRAGWSVGWRGGAVGNGGVVVGRFCDRGGLNQGGCFVIHAWIVVQSWAVPFITRLTVIKL